jgi:hypothetical protein
MLELSHVGEAMNPANLTTIATGAAILLALWQILSHLDKRNADRFDALQKQIEAIQNSLQKQIEATKETLRAEMREMRAELRLEIRDAAERRVR